MFAGNFPEFVTRFRSLKQLDLSNNMFSGSIPVSVSELNLENLNLSHNNFSGVLPNFGESKFGVEDFEGNNPGLCGPPLKSCRGSSGLSSGAIAGIVIGLMTGAVVFASLLIGYVQGKKRKSRDDEDDEELEVDFVSGWRAFDIGGCVECDGASDGEDDLWDGI